MQEPQPGEQIPSSQSFTPHQGYTPVSYPGGDFGSSTAKPQASHTPPYSPTNTLVAADGGLSDSAAGALAYITIIPAIVFLVLAPYNTRPFIKFHAFQCLGLALAWLVVSIIGVIPVLGWLVWAFGSLALLVIWILCIVRASQGSYLQLPVISDFASGQSGFPVRSAM